MRHVAILWLLTACTMACGAEPRWCPITGRGANDTLAYPPIARAARVQGVVLGRVVYTPAGMFVRFEPVSGPKMLEAFLAKNLEPWTIKTDAAGNELCQTLVIAEYRLDVPDAAEPSVEIHPEPGSTLRANLQTQSICLCDPEGIIGRGPLLRRVWHGVRRATHHMFGKHPKPWE